MLAAPMPSPEDLHVLDGMSRDELIARARSLGAKRPELMTRVELRDEIVRLTEEDPIVRRRSRGWLGVARDLVASVVDSGLNLPGAAAAIRGGPQAKPEYQGPAPVATLTLAEIYVAQGHLDRARAVLDEVLKSEPDHAAALSLRERLAGDRSSRGRIVDVTDSVGPVDEVVQEAANWAPAEAPTVEAERPAVPRAVVEPWAVAEPLAAGESRVPAAEPPAAGEPPVAVPPPPVAQAEPQRDDGVSPACALAITKSAVAVRYELERVVDGVTLRVLSFLPRREGPERQEIDVPVDVVETSGGLSLPPPAPGAIVRAVLGVGANGSFKPLVVAWVYDASASGLSLAFAPSGEEPRALRANLEAALRVGVVP
jgi:hypothetical protein